MDFAATFIDVQWTGAAQGLFYEFRNDGSWNSAGFDGGSQVVGDSGSWLSNGSASDFEIDLGGGYASLAADQSIEYTGAPGETNVLYVTVSIRPAGGGAILAQQTSTFIIGDA